MLIRTLTAILLLTIVTACTGKPSLAPGQGKNFGVSLDAKPNQGGVKVLSRAQGWQKSGKKNGYVGYEQGESGLTLFTIKKEDLGATCSATDAEDQAEWVITRLQLATEGDPETEKGSNFGQPQPAWLQEAFPAVDLSNGDLYRASAANGQTFIAVYNANQQEGYRFIYYQVTLTRCSDGYSISSDPAWGNGGRL